MQSNTEDETFAPFSWLSPEAQRFPLSRFTSSTRDLAQGLALVLEVMEGASGGGFDLAGQPRFDNVQLGVLSRFAVATAEAIATDACEAMDWLNTHGAEHIRRVALE